MFSVVSIFSVVCTSSAAGALGNGIGAPTLAEGVRGRAVGFTEVEAVGELVDHFVVPGVVIRSQLEQLFDVDRKSVV